VDEPQPVDGICVITPVIRGGPGWCAEEANPLVVANGVRPDADGSALVAGKGGDVRRPDSGQPGSVPLDA
jgi:hypothetical protein